MRRTLYRKLILIYVILAIAGFTLISTVGSRMVEDSLVSSASTSLYREATQIASKQGDLYYHSERSLTDLYNSLSALASYHNSQIWLISADGEILLNTAAALDEENPEIIDGFDPVALGSEYYSTGTFFGYFEDKMLSVMVPVTSDFRINGYVAIHLPLQDVYQQRESLLARIDFLFLLVFGLSFVILIFFSLVVYRPLKKIINGAKEYASGNLTHKIDVKSHDEMGYLASTLNYMSGELNKTGEYQRNFVANVSHDFRSPLTSIKGYVEAILDGTIPPEMQEKYLKIVLFETERLHKLTQSLLTLNDIDDKGNMLDLTSFDINAVIKDTSAPIWEKSSRCCTISLIMQSNSATTIPPSQLRQRRSTAKSSSPSRTPAAAFQRQASRKSGSASTSSTPPAARTAKERDLGFRSSKRSSLRITRISMSSVQRALVPNLSLHSPKAKHQNKPLRRGAFLPDISN